MASFGQINNLINIIKWLINQSYGSNSYGSYGFNGSYCSSDSPLLKSIWLIQSGHTGSFFDHVIKHFLWNWSCLHSSSILSNSSMFWKMICVGAFFKTLFLFFFLLFLPPFFCPFLFFSWSKKYCSSKDSWHMTQHSSSESCSFDKSKSIFEVKYLKFFLAWECI